MDGCPPLHGQDIGFPASFVSSAPFVSRKDSMQLNWHPHQAHRPMDDEMEWYRGKRPFRLQDRRKGYVFFKEDLHES